MMRGQEAAQIICTLSVYYCTLGECSVSGFQLISVIAGPTTLCLNVCALH